MRKNCNFVFKLDGVIKEFKEYNQENIQYLLEYDVNDLVYQILTDDQIITNFIEDQDF